MKHINNNAKNHLVLDYENSDDGMIAWNRKYDSRDSEEIETDTNRKMSYQFLSSRRL